MADLTQHFLIIGAGPIGLGMARELNRRRIPYHQVEASDGVGGNWRHGVYRTAHIISSRDTTGYPSYPMPRDYPDFPSCDQMLAYFEAYADANSLRQHLECDTEVASVSPNQAGGYEVTFADGRPARLYKGVLVCNGHHWARRFPNFAGEFTGELLHSKDYKGPEQFEGRRVLVIGAGNSACDLASEAARVATSCHLSMRRGRWFIPKTLLGRPTVELFSPLLPRAAQEALLEGLIKVVVGRYADYGLPEPDHGIFDAHPTINSEILHYLKHGRVTPMGSVAALDGEHVLFADGQRLRFDLIACATGFHLRFPFLPPGTVEVDGPVAKLIGGGLTTAHRHLYVLGTSQVRYGIGPLIEPYAAVVAKMITVQDRIDPPLGALLSTLGFKPPSTHLSGPFEALRQMRMALMLLELIPSIARFVPTARPTQQA